MPPPTKHCNGCGLDLPREDFYKKVKSRGKDPRMSRCKKCQIKARTLRYNSDPEMRARHRAHMRRFYERTRGSDYWRIASLRRMGLSVQEYDAMVAAQDGVCAICRKPPVAGNRKLRPGQEVPDLCVDHCHTHGHVRGLLCANCNSALGLLGDDPERVEAAVDYLRRTAVGPEGSCTTSAPLNASQPNPL